MATLLTALAAGAAGLTGIPGAAAAEDPPVDHRVVAGDGVAVEVSEEPFGLRFVDGTGREVLTSVAGGGRPRPSASVGDLLGVVGDFDLVRPRYAPITFTVGKLVMQQHEQVPIVTGNPLLQLSGGVQYSLTDVTDRERLPDGGLRLTVATDDPRGRTAVVEVRPDEGAALKTSVRFTPDTGVAFVGAGFASGPDEAFHGFGGRRNAVDQAGESFVNWIDQTPLQIPLMGGQPQAGWYQQAQFVSSRPYAFFLEQPELSRWRMRSDRKDAWQVESNSDSLQFTVAPGEAESSIGAITQITGRTPVPPDWQVAPIFAQTLTGATLGKDPATYEEEIRTSLEKIEELDLPYESFSFEAWWLLVRSGRLDDIIELIRSHGLRPIVYFRAWAGTDGQGLEDDAAFKTAFDEGYGATRANGSPYVIADTLEPGARAVLLDFTNPRTVQWWGDRIRSALDAGADGFMQDFGEQTMWNMRFADGSTGQSMHNRYPIEFHRVTRQIIDEWHAEHPSRAEPMFYVRAGYSGRPGSAAYESANWCGDYTANWSRKTGLGAVTTDMLNRAVGGAYGFHCDTGGYFDLLSRTSRELFIRWSWHAALTPGNRLHGGPVRGQRFPWSFDDQTADLHRASLALHRAAEPYILELWREARQTGIPITRPLWLHYPEMSDVHQIDQEYLLGSDVLVAPVVEPGVSRWDVRFPPGCWRHPETGAKYTGPSTVKVPAPLDSHLYYFKCGTEPFTPPN